ncbi:M23 family metallopeptidase [Arthrobacter roseus]|uniref:M23 family metallopeptidase n=1 Tax=Arthrobacter roseus TaxID=136274 RepID=UPI003375D221|nr:murein DD-endopeptidase MepM/ murein hydrolase activator NlpD [Arthrobacter roseus]
MSPADGRVLFVGTVVDRPVITVDHGNGVLSSFEPALAIVSEGDVVVAGKRLGAIGAGGHCESACLHWGVRVDSKYVDPLDFIRDRRPSILLPLPR